ncbi:hypothetical protein [Nonomuraea sp. NPDC048826]|uniref:hypothetical protein n=1 Tax=Nonomuraea sp. NPDC048826 TaxID=3364347 RepID=UPI00372349BA
MTIRRRWSGPAQPPRRPTTSPHPLPPPRNATPLFPQSRPAAPPPFQMDDGTRRLDYTPDLLPDVAYETGRSRPGTWWLFVVGGILLLAAVLTAAVLFSVNS